MANKQPADTAAIGLIDQHTFVRSFSPELMLVDPGLAERARALLREPGEARGKGNHMSALGTHEFTAEASLGLQPPLSPPVVHAPMASAAPADGGVSGLPSPPPAIRPPESAPPAPAPPAAPAAPAPVAEVPQQPAAAPAPPPAPAAAPAVEAPVVDYFAPENAPAAPAPAPAPAPIEAAVVAEPEPEIPLMAPPEPAPVEPAAAALAPLAPVAPVEPVVELPAIAPVEPLEAAPEPAPVEAEPIVEPLAPAAFVAPEPELEAAPAPAPELEELFAAPSAELADFRVVVRLRDGEGIVEVGSFRDFGTAMEGAQEVIEQFSTATEGRWPFYAGRFIRPDLIVSVDVVEGDEL
jgi:hypothetical protein